MSRRYLPPGWLRSSSHWRGTVAVQLHRVIGYRFVRRSPVYRQQRNCCTDVGESCLPLVSTLLTGSCSTSVPRERVRLNKCPGALLPVNLCSPRLFVLHRATGYKDPAIRTSPFASIWCGWRYHPCSGKCQYWWPFDGSLVF